jgi:Spy/CpxP family protein refolding chaperone
MKLRGDNMRRAIGAALLALMAATSWAADPNDRDDRKWRKDHDGKPPIGNMSPDERRELREMRREKMRERFDRADQDGDRALSREEAGRVGPRAQDKFDSVDTNKDGKASEEEIRAFRRERAKMRRIERGGADPRF